MTLLRPLTPGMALEAQESIIRFWRGGRGKRFADGWRGARARESYPTFWANGDQWRDREVAKIMGADTYLVSQDMTDLAWHACKSMPWETALETDIPSKSGIAFFETPVPIKDVHQRNLCVAALAWRVVSLTDPVFMGYPGVWLTSYSNIVDPRDEYTSLRDWNGNEAREGLDAEAEARLMGTEYIIVGDTYFPFGDKVDLEEIAKTHKTDPTVIEDGARAMHLLPKALWTLMGQRLAVNEPVSPERPVRRRLEKSGSPFRGRKVRLITLRRASVVGHEAEGESSPVEWTRRWIVSGHWRNVWHPSLKTHRLQWIAPFIKGPSDKPLVLTPTVRKLVR